MIVADVSKQMNHAQDKYEGGSMSSRSERRLTVRQRRLDREPAARRHRAIRWAGALMSAGVLVAACGSDDDDSDADQPTATAAVTTAGGAGTTAPGTDVTTTVEAESAAWDAVVEAAKKEGSVMFYSVNGPAAIEGVGAAFEAAYPEIDFEYLRIFPTDMQPAVETELSTGNGIADVVATPETIWLDTLKDADNLVPLADLPNVSGPDFKPEWLRGDSTSILDTVNILGWGYNTDQVPDGFSSTEQGCEAFLDPKYKGLIGVNEPSIRAVQIAYKHLEELCGDGFIEKLGEMEPRIYPGTQPMNEATAAGEIFLNVWSAEILQAPLREQGAPLGLFIPDPPYTSPTFAAVPTSAPHPNAALLLANFLLGKEANEARGLWPFTGHTVRGIPGGQYVGDFAIQDGQAAITDAEAADIQARWEAAMR